MNKLLSTLVLTSVLVLPAFADTADVKTGTTVLTLSNDVSTALDTAEVTLKKAQPARINPGRGTLTFVASGGAIDLNNGKTEIVNSGGISFTKGESKVTILDPIVDLSDTTIVTPEAKITAIIVANGVSLGRMHVFNIEGTVFSSVPVTVPKNRRITASNLSLKPTSDAVTALNTALGATIFSTETVAATASINVKLTSAKL
jgi:hypothetical protein